MHFVHCERCHRTIRSSTPPHVVEAGADEDLALFELEHGACGLRVYTPTGRAAASGPWHEPTIERRFEVRDGDVLAVAVGNRQSLEEPLSWRIERVPFDEQVEVSLDAELFWDDVDRALHPHHVPKKQVAEWATHIEKLLRLLTPDEVIVSHDDPHRPDASAAYPRPDARGAIEASLRRFGFDATTDARLRRLLAGAEFPPLRLVRRLARGTASEPAESARARLDSPDPLV